jgi:hypothetical protein
MSCDGLTLEKIIFGYTPREVLPPQQPVSNATMEQLQRWGEDVSNNFGTLKKSSNFWLVYRFPPNSKLWVSIRTVLTGPRMHTGSPRAVCVWGGQKNLHTYGETHITHNEVVCIPKTVKVKTGTELFLREKTLYRTDCIVPQLHSLQNAKAKKLTRKSHGNHGRRRSGLYHRLWIVRTRCPLPL